MSFDGFSDFEIQKITTVKSRKPDGMKVFSLDELKLIVLCF